MTNSLVFSLGSRISVSEKSVHPPRSLKLFQFKRLAAFRPSAGTLWKRLPVLQKLSKAQMTLNFTSWVSYTHVGCLEVECRKIWYTHLWWSKHECQRIWYTWPTTSAPNFKRNMSRRKRTNNFTSGKRKQNVLGDVVRRAEKHRSCDPECLKLSVVHS